MWVANIILMSLHVFSVPIDIDITKQLQGSITEDISPLGIPVYNFALTLFGEDSYGFLF